MRSCPNCLQITSWSFDFFGRIGTRGGKKKKIKYLFDLKQSNISAFLVSAFLSILNWILSTRINHNSVLQGKRSPHLSTDQIQ